MDSPPLTLALGAGAAKGLAHVGVLMGLEEDGVEIGAVAGSSMGSVIGALWAQGLTGRELEGLFRAVDWVRLGRILVTSVSGGAFHDMLRETFGGLAIEDLAIPFAAVCADLDSGEMVVLDSGDVALSVGASSSIPGILPPIRIGGRRLIDGAVVEPVPVTAAAGMASGEVLAVNVMRPPAPGERGGSIVTIRPIRVEIPSILRRVEGWLRGQREGASGRDLDDRVSRWESLLQAFHIMQHRLATCSGDGAPLLEPHLGAFGFFDFHRADEIIAAGYDGYRAWADRQ